MRKVAHGVLVAVLAAGVLAGCGDDDPPEPEPTAAPSEPTTSPSESESATPTDEPSPTVEPASGPELTFGSLTLNFPKGFEPRQLSSLVHAATGPEGEDIAVVAVPTSLQQSPDKLARKMLDDSTYERRPVRLEDVDVGGVTMYHVSGPLGVGQTRDFLGVQHGGYEMILQFTTVMPKRARAELIESVLASITWS